MLGCAFATQAATLEVTLAFVGPDRGTAWQGAQQGLAEAQTQGEFLGQRYTLATGAPVGAVDVAAIVADLPVDALLAVARAHPSIPVLNVGNDADALRRTCLPNLLHVLPSDEMRAAAEAQWAKAKPEEAPAQARAWHPAFEKYAAAQLNKRYRQTFGQAMDDPAWAGWAAVKLVSDTVARVQSPAPAALLPALRNNLAFDGQKGVDLSFRTDGQLRQPLLLVRDEVIVEEAPVRGVADIEDLDSLGRIECKR
jgi:hypothetical protein